MTTGPHVNMPTSVRLNDLLVAPDCVELLEQHGLDTVEAWFTTKGDAVLDKPGLASWRRRLRLVLEGDDGRRHTFYIKRFSNPPASARREVRRSGTGARSVAGIEWRWMAHLAANGIPCPHAVAFGESFVGRREYRSVVVLAEVPGQSLETWLTRWSTSDLATVRSLVDPTAELVARFHQSGFAHRDLYACHLFYDDRATAGHMLHLIDLQRVFRPRWCRRRWIIKDLAALNHSMPRDLIPQSIRVAWLKRYLGVRTLDDSAKRLARRIAAKTASMSRHDVRRQARLCRKSDTT